MAVSVQVLDGGAARIVGIERRNENSAAARRERPAKRPTEIVFPERESPWKIARTAPDSATAAASRGRISSSVETALAAATADALRHQEQRTSRTGRPHSTEFRHPGYGDALERHHHRPRERDGEEKEPRKPHAARRARVGDTKPANVAASPARGTDHDRPRAVPTWKKASKRIPGCAKPAETSSRARDGRSTRRARNSSGPGRRPAAPPADDTDIDEF